MLENVEINLIQWNEFGDHPLVTEEHPQEFLYQEMAMAGCGFIEKFQIVHPGDFILEINGHIVSVMDQSKVAKVFGLDLTAQDEEQG